MAKHKAWKDAERKVAQIIGGTRINGARGIRMEDVSHKILSIEVKHGRTCIPKFVTRAYQQAKANAPLNKIPVVVLHNHGSREYMALLSLEALARLLGDGQLEEDVELVVESLESEPVT